MNTDSVLNSDEKYFIRIRDPETAMEERVAAATIETVNETEDEEPGPRQGIVAAGQAAATGAD